MEGWSDGTKRTYRHQLLYYMNNQPLQVQVENVRTRTVYDVGTRHQDIDDTDITANAFEVVDDAPPRSSDSLQSPLSFDICSTLDFVLKTKQSTRRGPRDVQHVLLCVLFPSVRAFLPTASSRQCRRWRKKTSRAPFPTTFYGAASESICAFVSSVEPAAGRKRERKQQSLSRDISSRGIFSSDEDRQKAAR